MLQGPRIFCAGRALTPPGGIFAPASAASRVEPEPREWIETFAPCSIGFHADLATEPDLDTVAAAGIPIMPAFTQGEIWAEHGIGVAPALRDRLKTQLNLNIKAMAAAKARASRSCWALTAAMPR